MLVPVYQFLCIIHFSAQLIGANGATDDSFIYENCGRVINDKNQARECLNLTNGSDTVPLPVVLESTITGNKFICENKTPLYSFQCTLYGNSLVWYVNDVIITSFQPIDTIGRTIQRTIKTESRKVYNATAFLTHISKDIDLNIPLYVSTLTIQPFDESQYKVIPFNVTCQTFCEGYNRSRVCQIKHFDVAATPSRPKDVRGNITCLADNHDSIVSVNWLPPENENETALDYYELVLIQSENEPVNTSTTFKVDSADSLPYYLKVLCGNYTMSVTAVDMCGKRSEPSQTTIRNTSSGCSNTVSTGQEQLKGTVTALGTLFAISAVITILCISFCAIIVVIQIMRNRIYYSIIPVYATD